MIDTYIVSTYRPRFCGIAEFSANLIGAFNKYKHGHKDIGNVQVVAIDKREDKLNYHKSPEVITKIEQHDESSWIEAGESIVRRIKDGYKIGRKGIVLSNLEFGIIGDYGAKQDNLTPFLQILKKENIPSIIQLHTLPDPEHPDFNYQLDVLQRSAKEAKSIAVISKIAREKLLQKPYSINSEIVQIDHGVRAHQYRKGERKNIKSKYGLDDLIIVSTLGFNSPNKGRDYAGIAHSEVLKGLSESQRRRVIYLMVGGYHPDFVKKNNGKDCQEYNEKFVSTLEESGLRVRETKDLKKLEKGEIEKSDVVIYNKLLSDVQFRDVFTLSDIVINPTRDRWQVSSGILAEVLGYGRASISTESLYAKEVMSADSAIIEHIKKGRKLKKEEKKAETWKESYGIVVPLLDKKENGSYPKSDSDEKRPIPDIEELARTENILLHNTHIRRNIENNARHKGRRYSWQGIAGDYHLMSQDLVEGREISEEHFPGLREVEKKD